MEIRELSEGDEIDSFDSGDRALDTWFKAHARRNRRRGQGTTYVAVNDDIVVGFVATAATSVERVRFRRGQGPAQWPALLIARMAVSGAHQRKGIGKRLIAHAFTIADNQCKLSGCAVVIVDAKPSSVEFYRQFDFQDLQQLDGDPARTETSPVRMFIEIATVQEAMSNITFNEPAA